VTAMPNTSWRQQPSGGKTNVRTHTRKDPRTGRTQTVHQHNRKRGPNPGHAWKMGKRSYGHARSGRKAAAAAFALVAIAEIVLYLTGNVLGGVLLLAGAVVVGLGIVLLRHKVVR